MQSQAPAYLASATPVAALAATPQLHAPPTECPLAKLQQAWLEHQINPLAEVQWRGIPDSPLHD